MSEFDDLFKSRFEEHEANVPDDMWSRIQNAQAIGDVRRFGFYYKAIIGLALIAFIFLVGIYYFSVSKHDLILSDINKDDLASPSLFSEFLKTEKNNSFGVLEATKETLIESSQEIKTRAVKTSFSSVENNYVDNRNVNSGFNDSYTIPTKVEETEDKSIQLQESNSISDTKTILVKEEKDISSFKSEILNGLIIDELFKIEDYTLNVQPDYDKKCPKFGKSRGFHGYYSIEAYHSSDITFRNFDADNEEFNDHINLRSSTETSTYSYSNGLRFKWHNSSGLGIGVGIDRNVINERFSFVDNDAREVRTIISIDTLFNTDGTFETFSDTTRVELQGSVTNVINNSYTSIDLPIHLSFQKEFGRWAVGISGGIYINLLFDQKGRILNFDESPAWITKGPTNELDIYRTTSGVKFDASLTLIYHITPSFDLMAEPYFRYNPNSLTRINHPLSHFYNTAGFRTGLRYNFGF